MAIWYTWLAYFGLIGGVIATGIFGTPLVRTAGIGFAVGLVLVVIWNFVEPTSASCLQNSKGWEILRAYSLACPPSN